MFGSGITRFRIVVLLLAFGLGLAGQIVSGVAIAAQMQAAANPGIGAAMVCPGCPSDQAGGTAASCTVAACWTIPALPAQGGAAERLPQTVFIPTADVVFAGIATAPEPPPPRPILHA